MFTVITDKEDVIKYYPQVYQTWIGLCDFLGKKIDNAEFYYTYTTPLSLYKESQKDILDNFNKKYSDMKFNQRFEYELSKVEINLSIKIDRFVVSDRMDNTIIPPSISDVIGELTKIKMIVESDFHNNQKIKDSIPETDPSIISYEIIKRNVSSDDKEDYEYYYEYFYEFDDEFDEDYDDEYDEEFDDIYLYDDLNKKFPLKKNNSIIEFDLDEILDKITKSGLESLTEDEKKFLNDKSKGI